MTAGYRVPLFGTPAGSSPYSGSPKLPSPPAYPYPSKNPRTQALWRMQCAIEELAMAGYTEIRHETLHAIGLKVGLDAEMISRVFWGGPEINDFHSEIFALIEQAERYAPLAGDEEIDTDAA